MKIQTIIRHLPFREKLVYSGRLYRYKNWVSDGNWLIDKEYQPQTIRDKDFSLEITPQIGKSFDKFNDNYLVKDLKPTMVGDRLYIDEYYGIFVDVKTNKFRQFYSPKILPIFKNIPDNCEVFLTKKGDPLQFRLIPSNKLIGLLMPVWQYEWEDSGLIDLKI